MWTYLWFLAFTNLGDDPDRKKPSVVGACSGHLSWWLNGRDLAQAFRCGVVCKPLKAMASSAAGVDRKKPSVAFRCGVVCKPLKAMASSAAGQKPGQQPKSRSGKATTPAISRSVAAASPVAPPAASATAPAALDAPMTLVVPGGKKSLSLALQKSHEENEALKARLEALTATQATPAAVPVPSGTAAAKPAAQAKSPAVGRGRAPRTPHSAPRPRPSKAVQEVSDDESSSSSSEEDPAAAPSLDALGHIFEQARLGAAGTTSGAASGAPGVQASSLTPWAPPIGPATGGLGVPPVASFGAQAMQGPAPLVLPHQQQAWLAFLNTLAVPSLGTALPPGQLPGVGVPGGAPPPHGPVPGWHPAGLHPVQLLGPPSAGLPDPLLRFGVTPDRTVGDNFVPIGQSVSHFRPTVARFAPAPDGHESAVHRELELLMYLLHYLDRLELRVVREMITRRAIGLEYRLFGKIDTAVMSTMLEPFLTDAPAAGQRAQAMEEFRREARNAQKLRALTSGSASAGSAASSTSRQRGRKRRGKGGPASGASAATSKP